MDIKWKKDKGQQGKKIIDIYIPSGENIPEGRFVLYPVMEKFNIWCLFDRDTETQWYITRKEAEGRLEEILSKEKIGVLN